MAPHPRFQINTIDSVAETEDRPLRNPKEFAVHQVDGRTFVFQTGLNETGIGRYEIVDGELVDLGTFGTARGDLTIATVDGVSYLYAALIGMEVYRIGDDGSLTSVQSVASLPPFSFVNDLETVSLGGTPHLIVADTQDIVALYPVGTDGRVVFSSDALTPDDLAGSFERPFGVSTVEIGSKIFAYIQNGSSDDLVVAELRSDGTFGTPFDTGIDTSNVALRDSIVVGGNGFLVVFDETTGEVKTLAIDPNTGALTPGGSLAVDVIVSDALGTDTLLPFLTKDGRALMIVTTTVEGVDSDFKPVFNDFRALVEIEPDGSLTILGDVEGPNGGVNRISAKTVTFSDGKSLYQLANDDGGGMALLQITQGADLAPVDANVEITDRFVAPGSFDAIFRFPLANDGDVATEVSTTVRFYLSEDSVLDRHEDLFVSSSVHFSLNPGEVDDFTFSVSIPDDTTVGTYFLFAVADDDNVIEEVDETNNTVGPFKIEVSFFDNGDNTVELPVGGTHNAFAGNDSILGTDGVDTILGGAGADTINGEGSGDDLRGNGGNDSLFGGAGSDFLYGGGGLDVLEGNGSDDFLFGGAGRDTLSGSLGSDELVGGGGADTILGAQSRDTAYGGGGRDEIYGGGASDLLFGGKDADEVFGGNGDDQMFGDAGADVLRGGANADFIFGGGGGDGLYGGRGADILFGGGGQDAMEGGTGRDVFTWLSVRDSGAAFRNADVIFDFTRGEDKLNLALLEVGLTTQNAIDSALSGDFPEIDADGKIVEFIGRSDFTGDGRTAEVRWTMSSEGAMAEVDFNGNGSANMSVVLRGVTSLNADDFFL